MLGGHFFNFHAAFGRSDHHGQFRLAVDHNAQVQFLGDIEALLDKQHVDLFAFLTGLLGHQCTAEHPGGVLSGFVGRFDQHHAGLLGMLLEAALAAAARMNLRLDHGNRRAQLGERRRGFIRRSGDNAARDRHTRGAEQLLGLILVNLHGRLPGSMVKGRNACQRFQPPAEARIKEIGRSVRSHGRLGGAGPPCAAPATAATGRRSGFAAAPPSQSPPRIHRPA